MEIYQLNENLYISPDIDDWAPVEALGIQAVIDLDDDLDIGVPEVPNQLIYIYFPIEDVQALPDLEGLHAVARLGASLVKSGKKVLSHCGMGHNRCALMAGLILVYLGMNGDEAIETLRQKRPGALYNRSFAGYLQTLCDLKAGQVIDQVMQMTHTLDSSLQDLELPGEPGALQPAQMA